MVFISLAMFRHLRESASNGVALVSASTTGTCSGSMLSTSRGETCVAHGSVQSWRIMRSHSLCARSAGCVRQRATPELHRRNAVTPTDSTHA
jgi:hypothetical protein